MSPEGADAAAAAKPDHYCSFCGKSNQEVSQLIVAHGNVCICNECVSLCAVIILSKLEERKAINEPRPSQHTGESV